MCDMHMCIYVSIHVFHTHVYICTSRTHEREPMHAPLRVSVSYPCVSRALGKAAGVYVVGTGKSKRAKERIDV